MAPKTKDTPAPLNPDDEPSPADASEAPPVRQNRYLKYVSRHALTVVLIVAVTANGVGLAYYRSIANSQDHDPSDEITLGPFFFVATESEPGQVTDAKFQLHIDLIPQMDALARQELETHPHRVRQDVEELLRQAHGADFDDPFLTGLKERLRHRINQSLGMRAVATVIVTDLEMNRRASASATPPVAATVPWVESPEG